MSKLASPRSRRGTARNSLQFHFSFSLPSHPHFPKPVLLLPRMKTAPRAIPESGPVPIGNLAFSLSCALDRQCLTPFGNIATMMRSLNISQLGKSADQRCLYPCPPRHPRLIISFPRFTANSACVRIVLPRARIASIGGVLMLYHTTLLHASPLPPPP